VLVALVFAVGVADRTAAQMSADAWSTDAAMNASAAEQSARAKSGPDFPPTTYAALGFSLVHTWHFAGLGWSQEQIAAFLDGMRAAFQAHPVPVDEKAQRLWSDLTRSSTNPGAEHAGGAPPSPAEAGKAAPLSAYSAIGSILDLGMHCGELGWNEAQIGACLDGMRSALEGNAIESDGKDRLLWSNIVRQIGDLEARQKLQTPKSFDEAGRLEVYMKRVRDRLGLQLANSGLAYRVEGGRGGVRPRPGDTVVFTCVAMASNGQAKLSQMSGERIRMQVDSLLPGLMEGLQMMTIDGTGVFILPPKLSFGDKPWPVGVQRDTPIILTVTLYDVIPAAKS
jgi:FKBP-type peptidyl-prolyl cis-trans isomerase